MILVTGTTGLVGARLLPRLPGETRALVRAGNGFRGDLLDPASLVEAVRGVSAIIHLAAVFRTQDTDLIWKSNLEGTRNLIAAARAHAPEARFILASTTNVYDIDNPHPGREDDPAKPTKAYPASKLAAETELRESGLNWSIHRLRRRRRPSGSASQVCQESPISSREEDEPDSSPRHCNRYGPWPGRSLRWSHREYRRRGSHQRL